MYAGRNTSDMAGVVLGLMKNISYEISFMILIVSLHLWILSAMLLVRRCLLMANEDKKDFNAMLNDSKDMPKIRKVTDEKTIQKYGGERMYFAPPIEYDRVMRMIPYGKLLTVGMIREYFAKQSGADFTEPITAGIFVSIAAWASFQRTEDKTPYWRTLKANGVMRTCCLNCNFLEMRV